MIFRSIIYTDFHTCIHPLKCTVASPWDGDLTLRGRDRTLCSDVAETVGSVITEQTVWRLMSLFFIYISLLIHLFFTAIFLGQANIPLQLSCQQISVLLRGLGSRQQSRGVCVCVHACVFSSGSPGSGMHLNTQKLSTLRHTLSD